MKRTLSKMYLIFFECSCKYNVCYSKHSLNTNDSFRYYLYDNKISKIEYNIYRDFYYRISNLYKKYKYRCKY